MTWKNEANSSHWRLAQDLISNLFLLVPARRKFVRENRERGEIPRRAQRCEGD